MRPIRNLFTALLAAALCGTAVAQGSPPAGPAPAAEEEADDFALPQALDPLEPVNRVFFGFNDYVSRFVLEPVATGYEVSIPEATRMGIGNATRNLLYPVRLVGNLLQGKFTRAGKETGRFLVNSTVGVAGFIEIAGEFHGLEPVPGEDVGQAFAKWGIPHGPYLVLPVLGPITTRDLVGRLADNQLAPWSWDWWSYYEWEWATGLEVGWSLSNLPAAVREVRKARETAADPYIAVRNGYIQFRDAQVAR